ncbi:MAG: hypothetical protein GOMPHAMPRED_004823 [Gomphillus americanus]|uniref:Nitroreductase domain-containing protein n=1 Tax=Gomphillus americanus TaxID=1940652 RepID=A0A8H3I6G4_9LECA|nr:MAG: hypothetical protein GOMPHAMPRED_004823 [Gomphillus americanus]
MSTKPSTAEFLKAIEHRRTVYPLTNKVDVSDDRIVEIVQEVLKVSPSSYNTQPMRVAIMLGEEHVKLWKIVREHAMPILQSAGEKVVEMMSSRIDMFSKAYGSITFWTDEDTIKESAKTHQSVAQMFHPWAEHATGMLQLQIWTAIELEGLGANLQHMDAFPPVEAALKKEFGIPESWSMRANMNIGGETAPHPPVPEKKPFEETLKVFK